MSLINQMLKDLDKRKGNSGEERLPDSIRVVEGDSGGSRLLWGLGLLVVAGLAGGGSWWYLHRAPAAEALPASKRWPEPDQPQVAEAPAPAPPAAVPMAPPAAASGLPHSVTEPLAAIVPGTPTPAAPAPAPAPAATTAKPLPEVKTPATPKAVPKPRRHPRRRPVYSESESAPAESGNGAEEFYRQGLRSYRRGLYQQAQRQLERSLELAPDHAAARNLLARSYMASGQDRQAEQVLENDQDEDANRLKAQIYLKQGRDEQAERVLDDVPAAEEPTDLGVRAALKQRQGRYQESEQLYRRALKSQPGESRWWLGLAIALEASERYQEAIDAYRRALESGTAGASRRYAESRIQALGAAR